MVQGMGDDFPVGYSLNQDNWSWGGFGNFQMDLSNLFAITMANFRFQNFTGGGSMWNGFIGGGMGGFQMSPYGGAEYNFSTSGSGSSGSTNKTAEEKKADALAKKSLQRKHKALKDILTKYLNTLDKNSEEYKSLEYDLNIGYQAVKQENYDKLKEYYNNNKEKIKKELNKTDDWKKITQNGDNTVHQREEFWTRDYLEGETLKSGVDVMNLMGMLRTSNIAWDKRYDNQLKMNKAIFNALKEEVNKIKDDINLSGETKEALKKTLTIYTGTAFSKEDDVKVRKAHNAMYYWLRIAKAEIFDSQYACLNEDFSGDALLGKSSTVEATKQDLYSHEHFSKTGYCAKQKYD